MNVNLTKTPEKTILTIEGRIDSITAPSLNSLIQNDLGDTVHLVLDMTGVSYISSAGLRVLLTAQKKMLSVGSMKLTGICPDVMEIIEMTGFADILDIE